MPSDNVEKEVDKLRLDLDAVSKRLEEYIKGEAKRKEEKTRAKKTLDRISKDLKEAKATSDQRYKDWQSELNSKWGTTQADANAWRKMYEDQKRYVQNIEAAQKDWEKKLAAVAKKLE